ncbi:MAG: hypothetical protein QOI51_2402, partial [Nocardioidaceae bacterium]|nr:hypothetical protein [Nocardioidaceae bacterium]
MSGGGTTRYRWTRAYGLRFVGMSAVVLGVLWMIAAVLGFPRWSLVALAAAGIVVVACLVRFVVVPPVLLELSVDGYRPNGETRYKRRDELAVNRNLVLGPEQLVRAPYDLEVAGVAALR